MTFASPVAWLGLFAVAAPIVIHLLRRPDTRIRPFPTLRFFVHAAETPARRTRVTDPLLLLVRVLIIVASVAAFAEPTFRSDTAIARPRTARVVIIDTLPGDGASFRSLQSSLADSIAGQTDISRIVRTAGPEHELRGAAQWLQKQDAQREIDIVSAFRSGSVDSAAVAALPQDIGVRLMRIPARGMSRSSADSSSMHSVAAAFDPVLGAQPSDVQLARATLAAAYAAGARRSANADRIVISFPGGATDRNGDTVQPMTAWMVDVVAAMRRDTMLAGDAQLRDTPYFTASGSRGNTGERLIIHVSDQPGTTSAAAVVYAALDAIAGPVAAADTAVIPQDALARWERTATRTRQAAIGRYAGREVWIAVLLLLCLEAWLRRKPADAPEVAQ